MVVGTFLLSLIHVHRYTSLYIVILWFMVGFTPANHCVANESTNPEFRAVSKILSANFHVPSEMCQLAQLHLTPIQRGLQKHPGNGTGLAVFSMAAPWHFISKQEPTFEYCHIQNHLLHNYPSHHFW